MNMLNEMNNYHNFAYYYNQLIPVTFYQNLVKKINKYGNFESILDLACGSGSLCFLLKNDTNNVTGLDLSQEMLMIAQDRNFVEKKGIQFINQDLNYLKLNNDSYDLITCTLDSLNYLDSAQTIREIIEKVSQALQKGGYFCFDLLTQFYLDKIVADYYQSEELADFEYVWQVMKVDKDVMEHQLEIMSDTDSFKEVHLQFIYELAEIESYLISNGLRIVDKEFEYNELDKSEPARVYYFCCKE